MFESSLILILIVAFALDAWRGEWRKFHPLVGFGILAAALDNKLNQGSHRVFKGSLAWAVAVLFPTTVAAILMCLVDGSTLEILFAILLLYLAIGWRSLQDHALEIARASDLSDKRAAVAKIVSRDTDDMSEVQILQSTIESILENGLDAVMAVIFWFVLAGVPGVVMYRLVNTLDAMWGYKTERYHLFGRFAARADDLMNWIPARLLALTYSGLTQYQTARRAWRSQAHLLDSPNGGPVMVTGAAGLGIALGGPVRYHGDLKDKPVFGGQRYPETSDVHRALKLLNHSVYLWLLCIGVLTWMI